ncbi:MAG: alpha-mannosidase, partial [Planctomycetes bacterium]|nr:alpha-mannosidase [Planctomycetota bacterium]
TMDTTWKLVLLNQFHDIIPGSSIARVYEEAEADYARIIKDARATSEEAAKSFIEKDAEAVTVFNSLNWKRNALVEMPKSFKGAVDEFGNDLPLQNIDGKPYAIVENLPSCGWTTIKKGKGTKAKSALKASKTGMENEFLKLTINGEGEITRLVNKKTGENLAAGPCNSFRMWKDVPNAHDAWDIDETYRGAPVDISGTAKIEVLSDGPLVAIIKVSKKLNNSLMTQEIRLAKGAKRVDFVTKIDWQEKHKLLKVCFPVDIHADEAFHEVQFGHLHRPTHSNRDFDAARFEVCNQKWTALAEEGRGVAILNDCKYGINVDKNNIGLTLLRAPTAPDMNADRGMQEFSYSFYCWNGAFKDSGVVRESYDFNVPAMVMDGAAGRASLFETDAENIVIESVKPAEDFSGDVVVRLYETMRTATEFNLSTTLPVKAICETNMIEEKTGSAKCTNGNIPLSIKPFEIKTLRIKL